MGRYKIRICPEFYQVSTQAYTFDWFYEFRNIEYYPFILVNPMSLKAGIVIRRQRKNGVLFFLKTEKQGSKTGVSSNIPTFWKRKNRRQTMFTIHSWLVFLLISCFKGCRGQIRQQCFYLCITQFSTFYSPTLSIVAIFRSCCKHSGDIVLRACHFPLNSSISAISCNKSWPTMILGSFMPASYPILCPIITDYLVPVFWWKQALCES